MPSPVTTTRLITAALVCPRRRVQSCAAAQKSGRALLEELDRVADGHDGLGGVVRNFDVELLLERHHELDGIEAIGAEIVDEVGVVGHLVGFNAEVLDDDLLHALSDIAHGKTSYDTSLDAADRRFRTFGPR